MTRLSGALPEGDGNGLGSITRALIETPHRVHLAICLIDCSKQTVNTDTDEVDPTVRIRRIEPIPGTDKELATQMMRRAMEERTGETVLPLGLEDELTAVLEDVDLTTGEVPDDPGDGEDDS